MTMLSRDLRLSDMTRSATAIKHKVNNQPTDVHIEHMKTLAAQVYQKLCDYFLVALFVSSGYRSAALNALTPGASKTSQHNEGKAMDLDQDNQNNGVTNRQVFEYIRDYLEFDQLIWEHGDDTNPAWVHVSYNTDKPNRKQVLRARMNTTTKKTVYTFYEEAA